MSIKKVKVADMFRDNELNYIDISSIEIDSRAVRLIPYEIADRENIIAFQIENNKLLTAFGNKPDESILKELCFITGTEVVPFIGDIRTIKYTIKNVYEKDNAEDALKSLESQSASVNNIESQIGLQDIIDGAPAVKLTNSLLNQAILLKSSDIHIEPFERAITVRFRIDGILEKIMNIPAKHYSMVLTRVKVMSRMDITEKRVPQDGSFSFRYNNRDYDFRVSTLPTIYGEKVVIRVLYKQDKILGLDSLGFDKNSIEMIRNMLKCPNGILLATGPTGSGKSTTLFSILQEINNSEKNIITIEEPVEYIVQGINQVNVNNKSGISFAKGLKSILRQDPDVIMIGEIRDEETAEIAVRAAITGHLVLSTLHTNDAASSIIRLMDMKIPSYLLNDSIIGVIAQRLVRKICPDCKQEYKPSDDEISFLGIDGHTKLYRGTGCPICRGTGYSGRTVIYEIMNIGLAHKRIIRSKNSTEDLRDCCIENGMISMKEYGLKVVRDGITTADELMRTAYTITL